MIDQTDIYFLKWILPVLKFKSNLRKQWFKSSIDSLSPSGGGEIPNILWTN